jgi:hypothetical protein
LLDFFDPRDGRTRLCSRMSRAASGGTMPAAAMASAAAVSTSSQVSYRRWSLQIRPFQGAYSVESF